MKSSKNIDFDKVADFYDIYVNTDFDVEFWKKEAILKDGKTLELMCGTGRIGLPLIEAGGEYCGLDYSRKLLEKFQEKLDSKKLKAKLIYADARDFNLGTTFDFIFIGFHSLAEVVKNKDKLKLFQCVKRHLKKTGLFIFSLHNRTKRQDDFTGKLSIPSILNCGSDGKVLEFRHKIAFDRSTGIATGKQFYKFMDKNKKVVDQNELDIKFHLIAKEEIEKLLIRSGFQTVEILGNYERAKFNSKSPYLIYRCAL